MLGKATSTCPPRRVASAANSSWKTASMSWLVGQDLGHQVADPLPLGLMGNLPEQLGGQPDAAVSLVDLDGDLAPQPVQARTGGMRDDPAFAVDRDKPDSIGAVGAGRPRGCSLEVASDREEAERARLGRERPQEGQQGLGILSGGWADEDGAPVAKVNRLDGSFHVGDARGGRMRVHPSKPPRLLPPSRSRNCGETSIPARRRRCTLPIMSEAPTADEQSVRIVLADDHAVMRSGLRMLLDAEPGFEVVAEAGDAETALRYVRGHKPDVLILDLNMPGGSGLDIIPQLAEEQPATRIVVLTMQRDPAFARQALSSGAIGYVLKSAADAELVLAVRLAAEGETYLNPQLGGKLASLPQDARPGDLTERELEVLRLVALGHTNPEIAGKLYVSVRTVEAHRSHIHQKLRLATRADLVAFALEHRLIEPPSTEL